MSFLRRWVLVMLTVLFWNMGDNPRQTVLSSLVENHSVDLVILAECPLPPVDMVAALNAPGGAPFFPPTPLSQFLGLLVLPRFDPRWLRLKLDAERYVAWEIARPGSLELLFFAVHLPSKLFRSGESQALDLPRLADRIRLVEANAGHDRTFLVGDFNMNPFESGVVAAQGLNAVMTRELAARNERVVDGVSYPFLYNPMWGHQGDATHEVHPPGSLTHSPPGTCYYPARESRWYYWNVYDQVLLRPSLLPFFRNRDLRVLAHDGNQSLVSARGLPDRSLGSDHLPVLFRLHC